jgi:hypothetical protein
MQGQSALDSKYNQLEQVSSVNICILSENTKFVCTAGLTISVTKERKNSKIADKILELYKNLK